IKVSNPRRDMYGSEAAVVVAPSGHIAGTFLRSDARQAAGQFQQPAGVDWGILRGAIGLETDDVRRKAKRDLVYPKRINPITRDGGGPIYLDGSRTGSSTSPWSSLGQRRGVIFMEKRLIPGMAFVRHQNLNEELYEQGKRALLVFMLE